MQKPDLLLAFKQPKQLVEIIAGCVSILGLFGCFHDSPGMKNLSLAALMAGVGTIVANEAMVGLYAETALHALERELYRSQTAEASAETQAQALAAKLDDRIALTQAQTEQLETLQSQLTETQQLLLSSTAQTEAYARDHAQNAAVVQTLTTTLNQQIEALKTSRDRDRTTYRQSLLSLTDHAKNTLTEAITHWHTSLTQVLETTANQRPELLPRLQTLQASAQALGTSYLQQIADLTPAATPQQSLDDILSLLHHGVTEFSALKVQHRNALNIADRRASLAEISQLQTQLQQYQTADLIPRAQHLAILNEFQVKKDEVVDGLITQVDAVAQELQGDTDVYVQLLIQKLEEAARQIAHLTTEVDRLTQPQTFHPATREDLRMGNQIIDYFHLHGVILDRAGSEYRKHEATLYFHTDRNPRLILPADLNEHTDKLPQITRCLNKPEFKYDPESGLTAVWLQLSQKPTPDRAVVFKSVGSAADFLKYLSSHPIRYRLIGDPGTGKTPLLTLMTAHILQTGGRKGNVANGAKIPKVLVGASYPNADTSQKDQHYPLAPFLFARTKRECDQAISTLYQDYRERQQPQRRDYCEQFFQLWLLDEADNTLQNAPSDAASKLREIMNDGGHFNIGWILAGQSVNTTKFKNWTNDDRKKSVEIVIGASKIRAWANAYASDYYGDDRIQALLKNIEAVQEQIEQENSAISDEAKRLRLAMVADPMSPKLFFLPDFDSADFDLDSYSDIRREADGILDGTPSRLVQALPGSPAANPALENESSLPEKSVDVTPVGVCPECGTVSTSPKGKAEASKQRYFCKNPECRKQTFTEVVRQTGRERATF